MLLSYFAGFTTPMLQFYQNKSMIYPKWSGKSYFKSRARICEKLMSHSFSISNPKTNE